MKVLKYIFSMMLLGGIISACADLDTKLTNEWSESDTWRDADMAQGVLLSVYQDVMIAPDAWDGNFLDAATDNALTRNYDSKVYRASQGAFSRSTNPLGNWSSCYDQLQRIHLFLDKGLTDNVSYDVANANNDKRTKRVFKVRHFFCGHGVVFSYYKCMEEKPMMEKCWDIRL